jgi:hypothetical protein
MLFLVYGVHFVFPVRGFLRSGVHAISCIRRSRYVSCQAFMLFLVYGVHFVFLVRGFLRSGVHAIPCIRRSRCVSCAWFP